MIFAERQKKIEPNDKIFEAVYFSVQGVQETFEKNCILQCYDKFSKNLMPVNFTISPKSERLKFSYYSTVFNTKFDPQTVAEKIKTCIK